MEGQANPQHPSSDHRGVRQKGNPKGEAVEANATILEKSANGATYDAIGKRYGLLGKTFNVLLQAARRDEEQRVDRTEGGLTSGGHFRRRGRSKYLLLTTFTKDGRPKPTAVWGAPDGDKLLIITDDGSWKAKRIRNTPRVTIQRSGGLGQAKGEPVEAVARILPKEDTRRVYAPTDRTLHIGLEIKPAG